MNESVNYLLLFNYLIWRNLTFFIMYKSVIMFISFFFLFFSPDGHNGLPSVDEMNYKHRPLWRINMGRQLLIVNMTSLPQGPKFTITVERHHWCYSYSITSKVCIFVWCAPFIVPTSAWYTSEIWLIWYMSSACRKCSYLFRNHLFTNLYPRDMQS